MVTTENRQGAFIFHPLLSLGFTPAPRLILPSSPQDRVALTETLSTFSGSWDHRVGLEFFLRFLSSECEWLWAVTECSRSLTPAGSPRVQGPCTVSLWLSHPTLKASL